MPDLATHVMASWLLGRVAGLVTPLTGRTIYLFALGSAFPDLLARAPHLVLEKLNFRILMLDSETLEGLSRPLHTPAGLLLFALATSYFFEEKTRARTFVLLLAGSLFHCLLDFCQETGSSSSYGWFYPLSSYSPQWGIFSGDQTVLFLPWLLVSVLLLELAHWLLRRRGRRHRGRSHRDRSSAGAV